MKTVLAVAISTAYVLLVFWFAHHVAPEARVPLWQQVIGALAIIALLSFLVRAVIGVFDD